MNTATATAPEPLGIESFSILYAKLLDLAYCVFIWGISEQTIANNNRP